LIRVGGLEWLGPQKGKLMKGKAGTDTDLIRVLGKYGRDARVGEEKSAEARRFVSS